MGFRRKGKQQIRPVEWTRTNPALFAAIPRGAHHIGAYCARCGWWIETYRSSDGHNRTIGHASNCPSPAENWWVSALGAEPAGPHAECGCPLARSGHG